MVCNLAEIGRIADHLGVIAPNFYYLKTRTYSPPRHRTVLSREMR